MELWLTIGGVVSVIQHAKVSFLIDDGGTPVVLWFWMRLTERIDGIRVELMVSGSPMVSM